MQNKDVMEDGSIQLRKQIEEITSGKGVKNIATNLKVLGLKEGVCDI